MDKLTNGSRLFIKIPENFSDGSYSSITASYQTHTTVDRPVYTAICHRIIVSAQFTRGHSVTLLFVRLCLFVETLPGLMIFFIFFQNQWAYRGIRYLIEEEKTLSVGHTRVRKQGEHNAHVDPSLLIRARGVVRTHCNTCAQHIVLSVNWFPLSVVNRRCDTIVYKIILCRQFATWTLFGLRRERVGLDGQR